MKMPHIFFNRQFRWVITAVAIVTLVFLLLNIFVIGGDLFIFTFNGSVNAPLAIIITIFAANVWRLTGKEKQNRFLWSGLLIGWALWALAETIWSVYSILNQEVPYPSIADLFWMIGYIPFGIGLTVRIRTMSVRPNRFQNTLIWGVSATTVLITVFFILIPIFQSFNSQRLIEFIPNLFYPLADLFLAIIVWRLFFTYEQGDYGFSWRFLAVGFITMTVADLLFTYTTWNEIYYPNMQANAISRLGVDVPYTVSYLVWLIGIYALRILLKEEHPLEPSARVRMVRTYGHILIYTKEDDTVIGVSPNFDRLFETASVKGKSLADVLTISEQDGHDILEKLHREGRLADLSFRVRDRSGAQQEVKLSGVAVNNPRNMYMGSNLLLLIRVADASFDDRLDPESKSMTRYLLMRSGSQYKAEIVQFLSDYYLSYIKALLEMTSHQGGTAISQALLDHMRETAKKHNWQIEFNLLTVLDSANYPLEVMRAALPVLLKTAKQFVSEITGAAVVEACMREVSSQFSEVVHRDVARYEKAESDVGFSYHRQEVPDT